MADPISVDPYEWNIFRETLAPLLPSLTIDKGSNTLDNRTKAALACCWQLYLPVEKLERGMELLEIKINPPTEEAASAVKELRLK